VEICKWVVILCLHLVGLFLFIEAASHFQSALNVSLFYILLTAGHLQAKITSLTRQHETELTMLKERNTYLQRAMNRHEQDYAKRTDTMERQVADAKQQVEEERQVNRELRRQIGTMEAERWLVEEGRKRMVDAEGVKKEQLVVLKETVAELERVNGELVEKGNTLRKRYETNDLVGLYLILAFCAMMFVVLRLYRWSKRGITLTGY
jgi:hypothetical protein